MQRVLCSDCPECHREIFVNLGASHSAASRPEDALYRIHCDACGRYFDVHRDELSPREKTEAEIEARQPVTTFAWK
jgi:sarcosine oxidase delta subunit